MPISLTVSGYTESGHTYDDKLGEHYTFPSRYRRLVIPGETAVFYTGKRAYLDKEPLSYLGLAIVGDVTSIGSINSDTELFRCGFRYFVDFPVAVPFKEGDVYLESAANAHSRPPFHFSTGVRRIQTEDLDRILRQAEKLDRLSGSTGRHHRRTGADIGEIF